MNCFHEFFTFDINCEYLRQIIFAFFGYLISVGLGSCLINKFAKTAYDKIIKKTFDQTSLLLQDNDDYDPFFKNLWTTELVGIIERVIITTAIIFQAEGALVLWYGLKVISNNNLWDRDSSKENGRATFQVYLINNGLSLLFGALGGQIYIWLHEKNWVFPLLSVFALVILYIYLICRTNYYVKKSLISN